jgi:BirA family biotin operon repressor/biotin-[acetyl-CoA-carboxylase] ligase
MTRLLGNKIIRYDTVTSTNEVLKELALDEIGSGTVVTAKIQTGGRGRLGRTWESPDGGLWLSVLLEIDQKIDNNKFGLVPLMAGSSVATAILMEYGVDAGVKWPNDVMIDGRKVCGILCEMVEHEGTRYIIIGIGINVNNRVKEGYEFSAFSTSIAEEFEKSVKMEVLENTILEELDFRAELLSNAEFDKIIDDWRELSVTLGKNVKVTLPNGEVIGIARDIADDGSLILDVNGQHVTVNAGDCQHLD